MTPIALLIEPGSTLSSVTTTLDMFRLASRLQPESGFRLDLLSSAGGSIRMTETITIETQPLPENLDGYAAVIQPGFFAATFEQLEDLLKTVWQPTIRSLRLSERVPLIAASCYGTFVLAEAGLLNGELATTTWWFEQSFRQRYPTARLEAERTLADSGRIVTAGAMTAHTDLSLHVLRRLGGMHLARQIGSIMLIDGAKVSQRPFITVQHHFSDPLTQRAADWLSIHFEQPVSIQAMAEMLNVSYRTLNRRFTETTGQPPLTYLHVLRIERAKELLESTLHSQEEITLQVGYEDLSSFRRLFKRITGLTPAQYRRQFRAPEKIKP